MRKNETGLTSLKKYEISNLNKVTGGSFKTTYNSNATGMPYRDYYSLIKANNETGPTTSHWDYTLEQV